MSELVAVPDKKMPNLYRVMYEKGEGATPDVLSGLFSTRIAARKKIEAYKNRPMPVPIEYNHQKNISNEEEAALEAKIQIQVDAENAEREKNSGKEEKPKSKNKS